MWQEVGATVGADTLCLLTEVGARGCRSHKSWQSDCHLDVVIASNRSSVVSLQGKEMASLVSGNGSSSNGQPVEGFKLEHVNLEIQRGELLMVIGEVGSGKTSLLMGLLRGMAQKGGEVLMAGSIAYTSQDTWIQNATLQDNILVRRGTVRVCMMTSQ